MRTQTHRFSLQRNNRPSILCQQSTGRNPIHSRSPYNASKGKSPMKMKKFNSHQLFVGAHRVNGETYLPEPPQSTIFSSKHSTLDTPRIGKKSQLLSDGKSTNFQSKLQIQRVVSINIDKVEEQQGDLTRLIQQSPDLNDLKQDSFFGNISTVKNDFKPNLNVQSLQEIQLKKSDTIQQLLLNLKEHKV